MWSDTSDRECFPNALVSAAGSDSKSRANRSKLCVRPLRISHCVVSPLLSQIGLECLTLPSTDTVTTPLTTLAHYLRQSGLNDDEVQQSMVETFGIDESIEIGGFEPFHQVRTGHPAADDVLLAVTELQGVTSAVTQLLSGMARVAPDDPAARATLARNRSRSSSTSKASSTSEYRRRRST